MVFLLQIQGARSLSSKQMKQSNKNKQKIHSEPQSKQIKQIKKNNKQLKMYGITQ